MGLNDETADDFAERWSAYKAAQLEALCALRRQQNSVWWRRITRAVPRITVEWKGLR